MAALTNKDRFLKIYCRVAITHEKKTLSWTWKVYLIFMQNSNFGSIIKESLKLISDLQNGITHTPFIYPFYILHFATIFIALRKPSFNRWNRGLVTSFRCWYRQLCGGDCSSTSWRHFERYVSCSGSFCFLFRIELRGRLDSFVWQWSWDRLSPCAPHHSFITSLACSYCLL